MNKEDQDHMEENRTYTMSEQPLLYDEDGLPAEAFTAFSEDPLDFEEMTVSLRKNLMQVYELTGTLNRYSRNYPVCCRLMEQLIRRLGSCLVTKAALEYKGVEFSALRDMDIRELYCMVSFNFRKTDAAFREGKEKNRCADMGLLEQQCRLADLAERLKSTEEKIRLIRAGKADIEGLLDRAEMYKGQVSPAREKRENRQSPAKAPSLPFITSVIAQVLRARKADEKREREMEKMLNDDPFKDRPFKTMSRKQFMEWYIGTKKQEKAGKKTAEASGPARPAKKEDRNYIKEAADKMLRNRPDAQAPRVPVPDKTADERMLHVFEGYKRFMGGKGTPQTGRA